MSNGGTHILALISGQEAESVEKKFRDALRQCKDKTEGNVEEIRKAVASIPPGKKRRRRRLSLNGQEKLRLVPEAPKLSVLEEVKQSALEPR